MLYVPPNPNLGLWDTWLFRSDDAFHLFHLQRELHEIGCSSIGHAVTTDWTHWTTLPPVLSQGPEGSWDAGPLMTGMTLHHEGRYYLFYGSMVDRVQRIGLAISDDLIHWEKYDGNPILEPGGEWYETAPQNSLNYETAWRDPYIFYYEPDACFYAFICARVSDNRSDVGGGCIAVARSTTLTEWELLPPAYVSDSITCLEVPEYFALNGKHYITFTNSYHFGTPYPVTESFQTTGTFYLVSGDGVRSGYQVPEQNTLNGSLPNLPTTYVGRSIPAPPGHSDAARIYYYHHVYPPIPGQSPRGVLGFPKYLVDGNGAGLQLTYAPTLMESHVKPKQTYSEPIPEDRVLKILHPNAFNAIVEATVTQPYAGIVFRAGAGRENQLEGQAVWLAPTERGSDDIWIILGTVHFTDSAHGPRPAFNNPASLRLLQHEGTAPYQLRIVFSASCIDVFVDDVFYLSHTYADNFPFHGAQVGVFYAGAWKTDVVTSAALQPFRTNG